MYQALLICNSVYPADPAKFPALNGPTSDGLRLWRQLTDADTGLFNVDNVTVLFERGQREILAAIERIYARASIDDTMLLYFSGHGTVANEKLYLCARDSIGQTIRSTGISTEVVSDVIHASKAGVSVILLDCCHSGGFKGGGSIDDLALHELKGEGRYVVTATTPTELALDASEPGAPSPFTAALIQSLAFGANDTNSDGYVDIDDLMRDLQDRIPPNAPRPERDFDGSGIVRVARRASLTSDATVEVDPSAAAGSQAATIFRKGSISGFMTPARKRGDITRADVRRWAPVALASVAACISAVYVLVLTYRYYPSDRAFERYQSVSAVIVGGAFIIVSLIEGVRFWYRKIDHLPRREIVETLNTSPPKVIRYIQYILLIACLVIVLSPLSGRGYVMRSWVVCLSCLGAILFLFFFRKLNFGDEAISTAGALAVVGNVVPVWTEVPLTAQSRGLGSGQFESGAQTFDGQIYIVLGLALVAAWYWRLPKLVVAGILAIFCLCLLANAGRAFSDVQAHWLVTTIAIAVGIVGASLGSGNHLPLQGQLTYGRMGR